jgi:acetyl esterase/lipase
MPADESFPVSRRTLMAGFAALLTSACSRAIFLAANVPASFGDYTRHADLSYGTSAAHTVDVYVPHRPATAPRPLVVFWYGGRWTDGDKGDYRFVGAALAALGYVAVLPNYRHYPEVKMAGFMDDAARAAQWAVAHGAEFGADPSRLYLMGHSAGAHIAALVTLDTRYFAATGRPAPVIAGMIGLSGPYDFLPLTDADLQDMFGPPENYPNSQPINFVRSNPPGALESGFAGPGDVPAMLLIVGLKDEAVAPKNSLNLAAALQRHGVPVTLKTYPKLKHADTVAAMSLPARGRAPTITDIEAFVSRRPSS